MTTAIGEPGAAAAAATESERGKDGNQDRKTKHRCGPAGVPGSVLARTSHRRATQADHLGGAATSRRTTVPKFPLGHRRAQNETFVCGATIGAADHAGCCGLSTQGKFGRIIRREGRSAIPVIHACPKRASGGASTPPPQCGEPVAPGKAHNAAFSVISIRTRCKMNFATADTGEYEGRPPKGLSRQAGSRPSGRIPSFLNELQEPHARN
jgi:hypothetical protein